MWPYWLIFMVPALAAVLASAQPPTSREVRDPASATLGWVVVGVALTLVMGYRLEVGGDWFNYLDIFENVRGVPLVEILTGVEPGYYFLNWLSIELGWGVFGVNVVCGGLFSFGLLAFCRTLPRPWLGLAVAVPYVVIVVGMGYSRQAVALACGMLAIVALRERSIARFVVWAILGATFHRTAVLLLPIGALVNTHNRYWIVMWLAVITVAAYVLLLSESVENLYVNYVEAEYQSEGALIRLMMNAVPAFLLLWRWRRFRFRNEEASLWRWFAMISLALLVILFVSPSSTAVDRVGLYMLPLQLVVFSHLPNVLAPEGRQSQAWALAVVLYYALVLFVWLNFATHAEYWIPYQFYLLQGYS